MEKDKRMVVGSFSTHDQVKKILSQLKNEGYRREDIKLYADQKNIDQLRASQEIMVKTNEIPEPTERNNQENEEDEDSFWNQVKDLFSKDLKNDMYLSNQTGPQEKSLLHPYKEEIAKGHIVVVVNNYHGDASN